MKMTKNILLTLQLIEILTLNKVYNKSNRLCAYPIK